MYCPTGAMDTQHWSRGGLGVTSHSEQPSAHFLPKVEGSLSSVQEAGRMLGGLAHSCSEKPRWAGSAELAGKACLQGCDLLHSTLSSPSSKSSKLLPHLPAGGLPVRCVPSHWMPVPG